jgi:hypothetical protein
MGRSGYGDRLTSPTWGRRCPGPRKRADRRRRVFDVEAMFAEAGAPADPLVPTAIAALASFAGADSVHYSSPVALGVS